MLIETLPLHIHESIHPSVILKPTIKETKTLEDFFENDLSIVEAGEYYEHEKGWCNRMIAGDSLLIMNSLIKKEPLVSGRIQMIYFDPPYGIKFNSNFQPSVFNKDANDIEQRPEQIQAFRDTWKRGTHSYLSMMRQRLVLAKKILADTGSIFIQISIDNVHRIRCLLDEIFGAENFVWEILFRTAGGGGQGFHPTPYDFILWYAKDKSLLKESGKLHELYLDRTDEQLKRFDRIHMPNGNLLPLPRDGKIPKDGRVCKYVRLLSQGSSTTDRSNSHKFPDGTIISIPPTVHWTVGHDMLDKLFHKKRLYFIGKNVYFINYLEDYPAKMNNVWEKMNLGANKIYTVQTKDKVIERCISLCSDPGDLILDITSGSGTTAYAAEKLGRRWIVCDTSKIAIATARFRLMTSVYPWYKLKSEKIGICGGLVYEHFEKLTPSNILNPPVIEKYDRPIEEKKRVRISGPFTIEGVPSPVILSGEEQHIIPREEWADKLLVTGISTKTGSRIQFEELYKNQDDKSTIHYYGETKNGETMAVSLGQKYNPLGKNQVEMSLNDVDYVDRKIKTILFVATAFDPEALNLMDKITDKIKDKTMLAVEVNNDMLIKELKDDPGDQSFTLIGKPRINIEKNSDENIIVKLKGYDYYDPKKHELTTGKDSDVAIWMLDTDYDERTLRVKQMFFPGACDDIIELGEKLKSTLRESINVENLHKYCGNESLPFKIGDNKRIAVKIIDSDGHESMRSLKIEGWL